MKQITSAFLLFSFLLLTAGTQMGGCGCGSSFSEQEPRLSLLAGKLGGPGNTDGIGPDARFLLPGGGASDGTFVYIADTHNHTIRRIKIDTGEVTTLAGTPGLWGSDDGTGASARFYYPSDLAIDGSHLYVADTQNSTIRKVDVLTGVVTTPIGSAGIHWSMDGTGPNAGFSFPIGIACDGTHLYIADTQTSLIRRIEISTGEVTTLAGRARFQGSTDGVGSDARFSFPEGIATDGIDLFVADTNNHTIRRIQIATGLVTTLAGIPKANGSSDGVGDAARFHYPKSLSLHGTDLYVTDSQNHTIRKIEIDTRMVSTLAGKSGFGENTDGTGSAARFRHPSGITASGGNLYVSDRRNNSIRKIEIATEKVTTLAGYSGEWGGTDGTGEAARFYMPTGITTDGINLYVADLNTNAIRKVEISSGKVTTLAGKAFVAGNTNGTGSAARFNGPTFIETDGIHLYVSEWWNNTIRTIDLATEEVSTLVPENMAEPFFQPGGLATDGSHLYVSDVGNHTIRRIMIATGEISTLAGTPQEYGSADGIGPDARFSFPRGLAIDGPYLYIADSGNHTIRRMHIATREIITLAGAPGQWREAADGFGSEASFYSPRGLAIQDGRLYVADWGNHAIRMISLNTGEVSTPVGTLGIMCVEPGPLPATINTPVGVTIASGKIFIVSQSENSILSAPLP